MARLDSYQAELKKAQADQRTRQRVADNSGIYESARAKMSKSLTPDEMAAVSMSLGEMGDLAKDVTAGAYPTAGTPGNFQPYDLSGPAKILVPVTTPVRNQTPREQGQGGAAEFRVITGFSNAGVGQVNDLGSFFKSETTTTAFGSLSLRRPQKIEYGYLDKITAYVEMGLSDMVTEKAYFSALGFDNPPCCRSPRRRCCTRT